MIWILHSRRLINKINHIHQKALRIVYSDYKSSFNKLLDTNSSFAIHKKKYPESSDCKHLHGLSICCLSPTILGEAFKVNETILYNLRIRNELYPRNPKRVRYGTKTIFLTFKNLGLDTTKYKRF